MPRRNIPPTIEAYGLILLSMLGKHCCKAVRCISNTNVSLFDSITILHNSSKRFAPIYIL